MRQHSSAQVSTAFLMAPKFSKHGSWRGFRKTQLQAVERWQGDRDLLPFGCQHTVLQIPAMKPVEPLGQVRVPYARPAPHVTIIRTRIVYLFSERRKAMQKRIVSLPLPSQISNSTARVRQTEFRSLYSRQHCRAGLRSLRKPTTHSSATRMC